MLYNLSFTDFLAFNNLFLIIKNIIIHIIFLKRFTPDLFSKPFLNLCQLLIIRFFFEKTFLKKLSNNLPLSFPPKFSNCFSKIKAFEQMLSSFCNSS